MEDGDRRGGTHRRSPRSKEIRVDGLGKAVAQRNSKTFGRRSERRKGWPPDARGTTDSAPLSNPYERVHHISTTTSTSRPGADRKRCVGQVPSCGEEDVGGPRPLGEDRTMVGHDGYIVIGQAAGDLSIAGTEDLPTPDPGRGRGEGRITKQRLVAQASRNRLRVEEEMHLVVSVLAEPCRQLEHEVAVERDPHRTSPISDNVTSAHRATTDRAWCLRTHWREATPSRRR